MAEAKQDLRNATDIDQNKKADRRLEITFARQAVQRAEDARLVTLRKQAAERQLNADNAKRDAEAAAQQSQLQAQQSQLEAERARAAQAEADADRARAEAAAAEAQARAAAANKSATDANAVREKLRSQLNSVLATSESARGLIVNMSDVLFDTGSYTLKPGAREKLAKISGIVLAHPGLTLQIEGHTDSVGGDDFNQQLSERRADSVRDFLAEQGVPGSNITARGFGKMQPVASNDTPEGRQRNRRVELVVNGDAIGNTASASAAVSQP
jgi:outer membrane protein OmpA-like peptidoglycan-associated protein